MDLDNAQDAQVQLSRSQKKQAHADHLHKLALCLGVDVISSVQRPVSHVEHHRSDLNPAGGGLPWGGTRQTA